MKGALAFADASSICNSSEGITPPDRVISSTSTLEDSKVLESMISTDGSLSFEVALSLNDSLEMFGSNCEEWFISSFRILDMSRFEKTTGSVEGVAAMDGVKNFSGSEVDCEPTLVEGDSCVGGVAL